MKKFSILSLVFSIFIFTTCKQLNEDELNNLNEERLSLKAICDDVFNSISNEFEKNMLSDENGLLRIELKNTVSSSLASNDLFSSNTSFLENVHSSKEVNSKIIAILSKERNDRISDFSIYKNEFYTKRQKKLLNSFINKIFELDDVTKIEKLVDNFYNSIANSKLTRQQKIQLLFFNECVGSLYRFLKNGGINTIYNQLLNKIGYNKKITRITGCSIDTRSVVSDAIVGFFGGAISGCIAGATAGTVTFPVIGTVTGCVGAGVVGGAYGFGSGAVYSIASQLLQTCFRNSANYCDLIIKKYGYNSKAVPLECYTLDINDFIHTPVLITY